MKFCDKSRSDAFGNVPTRSKTFGRPNVSERVGTRRNAVPTSERPISDRFGTRRNELVMSLVIEKPFRKRRNELVQALKYPHVKKCPIQFPPVIKIQKFLRIRVPHTRKPPSTKNQPIWRHF